MNILVTGGAGFIGRWVVKGLVDKDEDVWVLDNLSNGSIKNLKDFEHHPHFKKIIIGDVRDRKLIANLFKKYFDICIHLAAQVSVQKSIENPIEDFETNALGTLNILENARNNRTKVILVSTSLVYDSAYSNPISETHPVKPRSPYAASKLAAEHLAEAYYHTYGLPVVITRPFNTYGPFQKSDSEGGVVAIFIKRNLEGKKLNIYGDGTQTRDLLYVEDCAEFIIKSSFSDNAIGEIINAGFGKDISVNELALLITKDKTKIKHVKHIHPQSEIKKLLCDYTKAKKLLGWYPKVTLEEGLKKTEEFIKKEMGNSATEMISVETSR